MWKLIQIKFDPKTTGGLVMRVNRISLPNMNSQFRHYYYLTTYWVIFLTHLMTFYNILPILQHQRKQTSLFYQKHMSRVTFHREDLQTQKNHNNNNKMKLNCHVLSPYHTHYVTLKKNGIFSIVKLLTGDQKILSGVSYLNRKTWLSSLLDLS